MESVIITGQRNGNLSVIEEVIKCTKKYLMKLLELKKLKG